VRDARRERGVVLLVVLLFALLLVSSIATFVRRSVVDSMISRNRESQASAEALARGGVRLAEALLADDRMRDVTGGGNERLDTLQERWAQIGNTEIAAGGGTLRLHIEDTSARLNLNALFAPVSGGGTSERTELFLHALLEKVIEEISADATQEVYDVRELTANLMDWIDEDELRQSGGLEDEPYQAHDPPYRAANRALLSVDELRLVEGFDGPLVEALRPYVTVYPFAGGAGLNLNTAPAHVLSLLFYDDGVDSRLAKEDLVGRILKLRSEGRTVCQGQSGEDCTPISELVTNANTIHPPPTYHSEVFLVVAEARVGDVQRTVEAVIDRTEPTQPALLSWQVR
jgi:general secretion pathway protein K